VGAGGAARVLVRALRCLYGTHVHKWRPIHPPQRPRILSDGPNDSSVLVASAQTKEGNSCTGETDLNQTECGLAAVGRVLLFSYFYLIIIQYSMFILSK